MRNKYPGRVGVLNVDRVLTPWFIILMFIALFVHRSMDFLDVRYTTSDDIDYSLISFAGIQGESAFGLAREIAVTQGRLSSVLGQASSILMNTLSSQLAYDFINMAVFFLAIASIAAVLWRQYGREFSLLFFVLFMALFPQLWDHAPPNAYPVWFFVPIILFSISCFFLVRYAERDKFVDLLAFSFFMLLPLFFYELFVVVIPPLLAALAYSLSRSKIHSRRFLLITGASMAIAVGVFLLAYFAFKQLGHGNYGGTSTGVFDPSRILHTLYQLTIGAFSPYYLIKGQYEIFYFDLENATRVSLIPPFSLLDVIRKTTVIDLAMAFFGALVAVAAMWQVAMRGTLRLAMTALAVGMFIAIASMLLYSISAGYQSLASSGMVFYLGSRYAYMGWIIVIVSLALLAARVLSPRRVPLSLAVIPYIALGMLVFIGSATSSFLNERVANTMRINASKWLAVNAAMQCKDFSHALRDKPVAAPILWNHAWYTTIRPPDYWRRYTVLNYATPVAFRQAVEPEDGIEQAYFDYRMDQYGQVFSVSLALDYRAGHASDLMVLTPRDAMVRMSYKNEFGNHEERLSWGPGRVACGEYVLSRVKNTGIRFDSLHFEKSEFLSLPD